MTADALSQEEIDALLRGGLSDSSSDDSGSGGGSSSGGGSESAVTLPTLSAAEKDAAKKYTEMMANTQADMIGTFLAMSTKATAKDPQWVAFQELPEELDGSVVLVLFAYEAGLSGHTSLIFPSMLACQIGGTMVGEPETTSFSDMVADAFKEVMSTVLGNLNTALGGVVGGSVRNTQLEVMPIDVSMETLSASMEGDDKAVLVPIDMKIGDDIAGVCWQMISSNLLKAMDVLVKPAPAPQAAAAPAAAPAAEPPAPKAAPVEFEQLSAEKPPELPHNLDLIMDIGLEVRVELGRSNLKIRDVLNLGPGSVVELDKLAGEPVDLLVNDVIFAKGEVVVIDENFGVRITDILSLNERIKTLGEKR